MIARPIERFRPAELNEAQQRLYDELTTGLRSRDPQYFSIVNADGGLEGPFNAFLLQPALGSVLQAVGAAIRYETKLTDRTRELAILVVAAAWKSEFERHAHEPIARAAGVTNAEITAIREGDDSTAVWPDANDRTVVQAVRSLHECGDFDDELYDRVVAALGLPGLFELMTLVGYYATLAMQLRVLRVALPQDLNCSN